MKRNWPCGNGKTTFWHRLGAFWYYGEPRGVSARRRAAIRRPALYLEPLEDRRLLNGPTALPEPFLPVAPLGSLIYESTPVAGSIQSPGDAASFTLPVNMGEDFTVDVRPTNASASPLQVGFVITNPQGNFWGSADTLAPGVECFLQAVPTSSSGTYTITVTGDNGSTGNFTVQVLLNTALAYFPNSFNPPLGPNLTQNMDGGVDNSTISLTSDFTSDRSAVVGHFNGQPQIYSFFLPGEPPPPSVPQRAATLALTLADPNIPVTLQLEDGNGNVLATGVPTAQDVSLVIPDFIPPVDGVYYAVISGAGESDFSFMVLRRATFDLEPNNDVAHAQNLVAVHTVLGAIRNGGNSPDTDWYAINVNAGDRLTLTTTTPSDQGAEFHNTLVPQIDLYDNQGVHVANNAGQPKNTAITWVAQTTGPYLVEVSGANASTGEYVLDVEGATGTPKPPSVGVSVVNGHILQIVGDNTPNRVGIVEAGGAVYVTADTAPTRSFTGIDQIRVNSGNGNDVLTYLFEPNRPLNGRFEPNRPSDLSVVLGSGNDIVAVDASGITASPVAGRTAWNVGIRGGGGDDSIAVNVGLEAEATPLPTSVIPAPVRVNINGGTGSDVIGVNFGFDLPPSGFLVSDNFNTPVAVNVNGGLGNNDIRVIFGFNPQPDPPVVPINFNAPMFASVHGGGGNNDIRVIYAFNPQPDPPVIPLISINAPVSAAVHGGGGNDNIAVICGFNPQPDPPVSPVAINAPITLSAAGGLGTDDIRVIYAFNPQPDPPVLPPLLDQDASVNININGGPGADNIEAICGFNPQPDPPVAPITVNLHAGVGNNQMALLTEGPVNTILNVNANLGAGNTSFLLDAQAGWVQPGPCRVAVTGGNGNDSVMIRSEGLIDGILNVSSHLGAGNDSFLLDAQAGWVAPGPSRVAVSANGNDQVTLQSEGRIQGSVMVGIAGGIVNNTTSLEIANAQVEGTLGVAVNLGNADTNFSLMTHDLAIDGSASVNVHLGAGTDRMDWTNHDVTVAGSFAVNMFGGAGAAIIQAQVEPLILARGKYSIGFFGGLGSDSIDLSVLPDPASQGSLSVLLKGGQGTNNINFVYQGLLDNAVKVLLDGGPGNDTIDAKFFIDSRSTGALDVQELGGPGNDNLTLDVFFVNPDGTMTGSGHGQLSSFNALLEGTARDIEAFTPNVLVRNSG